MTLEETYERAQGDLEDILGRLRSEDFVARFIVKFPDDKSIPRLFEAWGQGDEKAAFHHSHTAKGVCANLALTRLAALSSEICEALREGNEELRQTTDIDALMGELEVVYTDAVEAIRAFAAQR